MKTFVVGDIHGRCAQLLRLLDMLPRDEAVDTLVFLGDLIDRGPDAPGCVDVVLKLTEENPGRVSILHLPKNGGKAEAVRAGMLRALETAPAFVGFWDADLATPLAEVAHFLQIFETHPEVEVVVGSRVKLMGRSISRRASRHYLGRFAATAISNVLGIAIYDTQCGAKIFRMNDALREALGEPFLTKWIFDVEILARYIRFHRQRGETVETRIYELPLLTWRDVDGSKVRSRDFVRAASDLWKIERRYKPRK